MKSMKWLEEKGGNPGILVARGGIVFIGVGV